MLRESEFENTILISLTLHFTLVLLLNCSQYHDLKRILDICGYPPDENYLFLGDYVDRGRQSLEVICLLICFKVLFPDNFFILRGNHEVSSINRQYGFYDECRRRYSVKLWKSFSDVFGTLPLAALVEGRIFCMHGGIPNISHHPRFRMEDIDRIARPLPEIAIDLSEIPPIETDLLWADPVPPLDPQRPSVKLDQDGYSFNAVRSVSHFFGRVVLQEFLEKFHLDLIVRAHEVVQDGYAFFGSKTRSKMCLTLFGAPNYTGLFTYAYLSRIGLTHRSWVAKLARSGCQVAHLPFPDGCISLSFSHSLPLVLSFSLSLWAFVVLQRQASSITLLP